MLNRDFISWFEAEKLLDPETIRQLVLRERLPAFIELDGGSYGYAWPDDGGEYPVSGRTVFAKWDAMIEWDEDDEGRAYGLRGWFMLSPSAVSAVFRCPNELDQYLRPADDTDSPSVSYEAVQGRGFRYVGPELGQQALWFRPRDIERLELGSTPVTSTPIAVDEGSEAPISTRERRSMLRLIRALSELAGLPERGAAGAVAMQLQQLGMTGPGEATIRKLLDEARQTEAD